MPRPSKCRKVCCLPANSQFGPLGSCADPKGIIRMTVDEYETIRLIDLVGMNQEDCAGQMNVARTTVQGIYNEARRKLAQVLVEGYMLYIEGGNYHLCDGDESCCKSGSCKKKKMLQMVQEAEEKLKSEEELKHHV